MTKSPRKNVPDVGIELGAACMPSELASDWATAPGAKIKERIVQGWKCKKENWLVADQAIYNG